jgi:hypothetical protein
MKTKVHKIAKTIAVGIFFMALFLNVKLSLEDPFIQLSSEVIAQTSSSNGIPPTCQSECKNDPEGSCSFNTVDYNGQPIIATCLHMTKK